MASESLAGTKGQSAVARWCVKLQLPLLWSARLQGVAAITTWKSAVTSQKSHLCLQHLRVCKKQSWALVAYIYCLPFEVCITKKPANVLYGRSLPLCARIRLTTALLPSSRFLNFSGSSPCISDTCLLAHFMQIEDQPTTGMLSEIYLCAYSCMCLLQVLENVLLL